MQGCHVTHAECNPITHVSADISEHLYFWKTKEKVKHAFKEQKSTIDA